MRGVQVPPADLLPVGHCRCVLPGLSGTTDTHTKESSLPALWILLGALPAVNQVLSAFCLGLTVMVIWRLGLKEVSGWHWMSSGH